MTEQGSGTDGEPARERILVASEELFAERGFDATPTSRIAERAGVPKGLVHYYFRRKADLLEALVERLPADVVRCSDVIVPGDLPASLDRLVATLDRSLGDSYVLSHLLWREADTHPAVRDVLNRRYDELVDAVREVIVTASGRPDSERVRGAARLLAAAIGHRHAIARHTPDAAPDAAPDRMDAELAVVVAALQA